MIPSHPPSERLTRRARPIAVLAALFGAACGGGGPEGPPPNVLLISLDSTRRDILSCYGREPTFVPDEPTSPHIDRLAAEGVLFEDAYATSSWTLPSHMALMTGQPDVVHAVEMDRMHLGGGQTTLAERLSEAGYRTAGFYTGPYLAPQYGFGRGFERYEDCYGEELTAAVRREAELRGKLESGRFEGSPAELIAELQEAHALMERRSHRDVSSGPVTEAVLEELEAARGDERPWFVFAHYFDPHYDYVPPEPYFEMFDPEYEGDMHGEDLVTSPLVSVPRPTIQDPTATERVISDRDLAHVRALYDGELRWTDSQVGRILEDLREEGELDETIVVLLSDHGDEFFEHGRIGHRKTLFEEVLQVPLIVRYPPALEGGRRVRGVASLVDVYATVLELVGLSVPSGVLSESLVPIAQGEDPERAGYSLGRLVSMRRVTNQEGVAATQTTIQETFHHAGLKVWRMHRWVGPGPETPPAHREKLLELADRQRRAPRVLAWIDLERAEGEPLKRYSKDFGDPRAARALERYRELYSGMLERRTRPDALEQGEGERSMLKGLGYAGDEDVGSMAEFDLFEQFLLPAPPQR